MGAYQVGALSHILGTLQIQYDIVVGTSVGAINGINVAMHPAGQEVEAAQSLWDQWMALTTKDVLIPRWLQPLSLLWHPSTHDVTPLRRLLEKRVGDMHKRYACLSVDIVSGKSAVWTNEHSREDLIDGIMASSMTPIIHPGVPKDDMHLYDGGLLDVTPAKVAIDMGATELDIILTHSSKLSSWTMKSDKLWHTAPRIFDVMFHELVEGDLRALRLYNALADAGLTDKKKVVVRVLRPSNPLPMDASKFAPHEIRVVAALGLSDARYIDWGVGDSS